MSANTRHVSWGHWSITFWQRDAAKMRGPWDTYNPGQQMGEIIFPVGSRGPIDGHKRDEYRAAVKAWIEEGRLPA